MEIKIIGNSITKEELKQIAKEQFGDLVKAVVDVEKEIMAVGGELHADGEAALMEQEESSRENTWGINIYPQRTEEDWIEFNSMINIKPSFGNRSRDVLDPMIRAKIKEIVKKLTSK